MDDKVYILQGDIFSVQLEPHVAIRFNLEGQTQEQAQIWIDKYINERLNNKYLAMIQAKYFSGIRRLMEEELGKVIVLPSAHQIGDRVNVSFGNQGTINNCKVVKVHFTESKVLYDVELYFSNEPERLESWSTRLYNIDSSFITK